MNVRKYRINYYLHKHHCWFLILSIFFLFSSGGISPALVFAVLHHMDISHQYLQPDVEVIVGVPEQIHLAYGSPASEAVVISYVTLYGPSEEPASMVRVSLNRLDIQHDRGEVYIGKKVQYTHQCSPSLESYCNEDSAMYHSPYIHHVEADNLLPNTIYYYSVGDTITKTQVYQFKTARVAGDDSEPYSVAVVGDIGQTEYSKNTMNAVLESTRDNNKNLDFFLIVGDLSYADGDDNRWDSWGRMMEPVSSVLPIMTLPGNHEIELDKNTQETFVAYRNRFKMPGDKEETLSGQINSGSYNFDFKYSGASSYYSFNNGVAHFICLNTYDTHDDAQKIWMGNDLESIDRQVTPWVFVFMHAPFYHTNTAHQGEVATAKLQAWLEPILLLYNIPVVISGHVHAYERSFALGVDGIRDDDNGISYIVVGDGGNHEELKNDWNERPEWNAYKNGLYYGHGELVIFNRTHASWEWISDFNRDTKDDVIFTRVEEKTFKPDVQIDITFIAATFLITVALIGVLYKQRKSIPCLRDMISRKRRRTNHSHIPLQEEKENEYDRNHSNV